MPAEIGNGHVTIADREFELGAVYAPRKPRPGLHNRKLLAFEPADVILVNAGATRPSIEVSQRSMYETCLRKALRALSVSAPPCPHSFIMNSIVQPMKRR